MLVTCNQHHLILLLDSCGQHFTVNALFFLRFRITDEVCEWACVLLFESDCHEVAPSLIPAMGIISCLAYFSRIVVRESKSVQGEGASSTDGVFLNGSALSKRPTSNPSHKKTGPIGRFFLSLHPPSKTHNVRQKMSGAGRGNRTLVGSLGSYCSTIKLYPLRAADFVPDSATDLKFFFYS